jgi:hypothetical protein
MDGYQLARVAPDGMLLVTTQLDLAEYSLAAEERELPTLWQGVDILASRTDSIVEYLGQAGIDVRAVRAEQRNLLQNKSADPERTTIWRCGWAARRWPRHRTPKR